MLLILLKQQDLQEFMKAGGGYVMWLHTVGEIVNGLFVLIEKKTCRHSKDEEVLSH